MMKRRGSSDSSEGQKKADLIGSEIGGLAEAFANQIRQAAQEVNAKGLQGPARANAIQGCVSDFAKQIEAIVQKYTSAR